MKKRFFLFLIISSVVLSLTAQNQTAKVKGQELKLEKVQELKLDNGKAIIIYSNGTWSEIRELKLDNGKNIIVYSDGTWKEKIFKRPTIEWVSIPAGTFTMGSQTSETDRLNDETQHQVTLDAFKMSKYEITFEQYDLFCEETNRTKPSDDDWGRGKLPVIKVSWEDAKAFAEWMGCRLPTEAEWEYACRAGSTTVFSSGDNLTALQANYNASAPYNNNAVGEYKQKTLPGGSFAANAFGLFDMHGNVWEWCSDWHNGAYSKESQTNPKGDAAGYDRVYRGGSWRSDGKDCRSARRNHTIPSTRLNTVGIRLVSLQ